MGRARTGLAALLRPGAFPIAAVQEQDLRSPENRIIRSGSGCFPPDSSTCLTSEHRSEIDIAGNAHAPRELGQETPLLPAHDPDRLGDVLAPAARTIQEGGRHEKRALADLPLSGSYVIQSANSGPSKGRLRT